MKPTVVALGLPRAIHKVMAFLWRMIWRVLCAKVWGVFVTTFAVARNAAKGIKGHFVALDGSREKNDLAKWLEIRG